MPSPPPPPKSSGKRYDSSPELYTGKPWAFPWGFLLLYEILEKKGSIFIFLDEKKDSEPCRPTELYIQRWLPQLCRTSLAHSAKFIRQNSEPAPAWVRGEHVDANPILVPYPADSCPTPWISSQHEGPEKKTQVHQIPQSIIFSIYSPTVTHCFPCAPSWMRPTG